LGKKKTALHQYKIAKTRHFDFFPRAARA